jgi:hypothetical protein
MNMRVLLFLTLFGTLAQAESKTANVTLGDMFKVLVQRRVAIAYSEGDLVGLNSSNISRLPRIKSFSAETDVFTPLSLHLGFSESYTQEAEMSFDGGAPTRGEIYLTTAQLGLKLFLPLGFLQPWAGAGYIGGTGAFTNPRTRGNDSYLAAFEKETSSVWGTYWHAGLDINFIWNLGIRGFFQEDAIKTGRYSNLQNSGGFSFLHRRVGVAFISTY